MLLRRLSWIIDASAVVTALGLMFVGWGGIPSGAGSARLGWLPALAAGFVLIAAAAGSPDRCAPGAGVVALALVGPGTVGAHVAAGTRIIAFAGAAALAVGAVWFVGWLVKIRGGPIAGSVVAASVALFAARVFLRDPFRELYCAPYCGSNPFLVSLHKDAIREVERFAGLVTMGWAAWATLRVVGSAADAVRRVSAMIVVGVTGTIAIRQLSEAWPTQTDAADRFVFAVASIALAVASAAAAIPDIGVVRARRRVRHIAIELTRTGDLDAVTATLRAATGDDRLQVRLGPQPQPRDDLTSTEVRRGSELVAVIEHRDRSTARLAAALSPVLTMAIENAQLLAQARSHLDDLRLSRERIVTRADDARRRLERDLHDGAQQRLLVLGMHLAAEAERAQGEQRDRILQRAADAAAALAELRLIARGTIPPILENHGLVEAILSLTEEAPLPMAVHITGDFIRPALDIERTAYRIIRTTIDEAQATAASTITVTISCANGLELRTEHDGDRMSDRTDDEDRIGALGGTWVANVQPGAISFAVSFS